MNAYRSLRTLQRCLSCRLPRLTIARPSSTWLPALAPQPIRITPPQCTSYSRHICASSYGTEGAEVEEGYEEVEVELPAHCPGCGVRLQQEDPNAAG